jgi:hypothetical protein
MKRIFVIAWAEWMIRLEPLPEDARMVSTWNWG